MANDDPWEQWLSILDAVVIKRPKRDMAWILGQSFSYHGDGSTSFYPNSETEIIFSPWIQIQIAKLANFIGETIGSAKNYGTDEIAADLLRLAGTTVTDIGDNFNHLNALIEWIRNRHAATFVVIGVGGIILSVTGAEEYANPILINERILVGYLDDAYFRALPIRSELSGVPGFLLEEDWWTERYLSAPGSIDEDIDQSELLTPWIAFSLPVRGVGPAALYEAKHSVQAVLGALLARSCNVGNLPWGAVPWLAGESTINSDPSQPRYEDDNVLSIGIQYRSRRSLHLEEADTLGSFHGARDIDIAEIYVIPEATALLDAVASESDFNSVAGLAKHACRQLLLAAQSTDPDVRLQLSFAGISAVLRSDIKIDMEALCRRYDERVTALPGYEENDKFAMQPGQIDDTFEEVQSVLGKIESGVLSSWANTVAKTAQRSMAVLQGICISLI